MIHLNSIHKAIREGYQSIREYISDCVDWGSFMIAWGETKKLIPVFDLKKKYFKPKFKKEDRIFRAEKSYK